MIYGWQRLGWMCYEIMILDALQSRMNDADRRILAIHRRVVDRVIRMAGESYFYRSKWGFLNDKMWDDVDKFKLDEDTEAELGRVRISGLGQCWDATVWSVAGRLFSITFLVDPKIRSCDGLSVEVLSVRE